MKRKEVSENETLQTKKIKLSEASGNLPEKCIMEILKYLDFRVVIGKCFLISKEWYRVAITNYKFNLIFSNDEMWGEFKQSFMVTSQELDDIEPRITLSCPFVDNVEGLDLEAVSIDEEDVNLVSNFTNLKELAGQFTDNVQTLLECLLNLTSLRMVEELAVEDLEIIVDFGLKSLEVDYTSLEEEHLEIIGEMKTLEELDISGNMIDSLYPIRSLTSLKSLSAADHKFLGDKGIAHIANCKDLEFLNISSTPTTSFTALFLKTHFPKLRHLDVSDTLLCDPGAKHISQLPQLTFLNVASTRIGLEGIKAICNNLKNLTYLNIMANKVTDEGFLMTCNLTKLKHLVADCNQITDSGVKEFCTKININNLSALSLSTNNTTPECVNYLTSLTGLKELHLCRTTITDKEVELICKSMKTLTNLDLCWNKITEKALEFILQLENLRTIRLDNQENPSSKTISDITTILKKR